ncbi:glycoside hydrolase family 16 protein [Mycena pura]|uniref:Glycoside hydrolase family 16 protein n=1 Tax=Mycena pura TaxID=153505 RepID=A0AAD6VPS2_9AGAR|nr:glycoside hydrolase family 16 protein [Mycena pura]
MLAAILVFCLGSVPVLASTSYRINNTFIGNDFFTWNWETFSDPTHGRVNYVDKATAMATNLSLVSETTRNFIMRADTQNTVLPGQRGRNSVRITSPSAYGDSVLLLDLWHMPTGCATWPAWWTVSKTGPWPHGGEIDIIEGVNRNVRNLASLHTTANCSMPKTREQKGLTVSTDCDASYNDNQGCGVEFNKTSSYGDGFNSNGGGYYAMRRGTRGIDIWFWPRDDPELPRQLSQRLPDVNPDIWGDPDATFPTGACNCDPFDDHSIVFDLTFCGDWAGSAYPASGCPSDCSSFVDNNPKEFVEAYWEVVALSVYVPNLNGTQ